MVSLNKKRYTAAVLGGGRIGVSLELDPKRLKPASHLGMWQAHPRVDLVSVADTDPSKLDVVKSLAPQARRYLSSEEMLSNERPDIVSICTWKDSHHEMMKLALEYDVPAIVLEKPIAEQYEHAREIVDEVDRRGVHLFVNHRRRFDTLLYPLRDELRAGAIGEVIQVSSYYVYGLVTTATHLVDALRFFLKDIAGEVSWVSAYPNQLHHHHPPDDPCLDGFLGFENGLKATIQSLNIQDYDIFDFFFYGRQGRVVFKNIGRDIEIVKTRESPEHHGFTELEDSACERRGGEPRDQFGCLADNVVDALEGRATSLSTGEDSLKALEILLAMQRSAGLGGDRVDLS